MMNIIFLIFRKKNALKTFFILYTKIHLRTISQEILPGGLDIVIRPFFFRDFAFLY